MTPPRLYGLGLPDALARVGHLAQLARIDAFTEDEGPARGARRLRMVSGGGLELEVHPDRALDLGQCTVHGVPMAWMSATGITHPGLIDDHPHAFLRHFGGGLLATCGLDQFGPANEEHGIRFPQHGRVGALPARVVHTDRVGDALVVEGVVQQAAVHHENLVMRRRIEVPLGGTSVSVHDTITNLGPHPQPHMVMYHCNFGWPLLDEGVAVHIPGSRVEPVTPGIGIDGWDRIGPPVRGAGERVWFHHFAAGTQPLVRLSNPALGLEMAMQFDADVLPALCMWQMCAERQYVLGLEPASVAQGLGRAAARAAGQLAELAPDESKNYSITMRFTRTAG